MTVRFMDVFTEWASTYDDTVTGHDPEYKEVFRRYEEILDTVATKAVSPVVEFGAGTGNLTQRLLDRHQDVLAVEPSPEMRDILIDKIPERYRCRTDTSCRLRQTMRKVLFRPMRFII